MPSPLIVGPLAVGVATIKDPENMKKAGQSMLKMGCDVLVDLGKTVVYRNPAYLKDIGWDILSGTASTLVYVGLAVSPVGGTVGAIFWESLRSKSSS